MLTKGRIPLTADEQIAIKQLLSELEAGVTLARRDPGESGPVLVQSGARMFEISGAEVTELG